MQRSKNWARGTWRQYGNNSSPRAGMDTLRGSEDTWGYSAGGPTLVFGQPWRKPCSKSYGQGTTKGPLRKFSRGLGSSKRRQDASRQSCKRAAGLWSRPWRSCAAGDGGVQIRWVPALTLSEMVATRATLSREHAEAMAMVILASTNLLWISEAVTI